MSTQVCTRPGQLCLLCKCVWKFCRVRIFAPACLRVSAPQWVSICVTLSQCPMRRPASCCHHSDDFIFPAMCSLTRLSEQGEVLLIDCRLNWLAPSPLFDMLYLNCGLLLFSAHWMWAEAHRCWVRVRLRVRKIKQRWVLTCLPIQSTSPDTACAWCTTSNIAHTLWGEHAWLTPGPNQCFKLVIKHYNRINPCFFRKNFGEKKRCNLGNCPCETLILFNAEQFSSWPSQGKLCLEQIPACTLSIFDIIHSGAVETLFLNLSSLSDIPRSHLKSSRHDKKKQRGKSRQRPNGADGATYVELLSHNSACLYLSFSLNLMSVSLKKKSQCFYPLLSF